MRPHCTTRRQPLERHARWHDERHDNVQRIGGHHGRVSSQTGCATPITADALTGPKYRLSNDAGLVTLNRNSSPGSRRRQSCKDGSGRPSRSAGSTVAAGTPSMRTCPATMQTCCGATAPTFEQRHARRQVAAARPAWRPCRVAAPARYCPRTADVAARRCAGRTVRCDTSRPPRCWTGCRSDAAAATRKPPRPAQRGRRRRSPPARGERIGASEDAARLLACMWY